MGDKELWFALQNLNLGSEQAPLKLSAEANKKRETDHRLSLVVKGLHPSQNPAGIKIMMPKIWKVEGRITSRINEDGSVQFFFQKEHHMLTVLDKGPWTYKDWLVVVDQWTRRNYPDYLQVIRFWVKMLNIPDDCKEDRSIKEFGGVLGHVEDVFIQQPTADKAGEVWVRVPISVSGKLLFARFFDVQDHREPILIRYVYDKLRKFCSACGSLTHLAETCNFHLREVEPLPLPAPPQEPNVNRNGADTNQMESEPHTPTEVADDTMSETVGSNINMDTSENQQPIGSQGDFMEFLNPADVQPGINHTFTVREVESALVLPQDRGTKRKFDIAVAEDEASTSRRKTNEPNHKMAEGEVVTPKPPQLE